MPKRFARYAAAVLAYNLAVVLWGAYVRATGSGAGCGNHWPLCNGEVVPQTPAIATLIEFTHRATSGIDVVLVAVLMVWAFRVFPRRHPARLGAMLSGFFLATEALIGAMLVKLEHVAHNASVGRAYSLSAHQTNTLTLLACLTLTAWWGLGAARLRPRGRPVWLVAVGLGLFILAATSGAITALGDTLFPAGSLAAGLQQDFDPAAHLFVRLRAFHPLLAVLAGGWLIYFGAKAAARLPGAKWFARSVWLLVGLQISAGAINLLLLAPVWMQMVHLLTADLLWIAFVLLSAYTLQDSSRSADLVVDEMVPGLDRFERAGPK